MPSVLGRIVAKVRALLPEDWRGQAGQQFRSTVDLLSTTVSEATPDREDVPDIVAKGLHRYAIGKVSREHAEAERNYAEEENVRIQAEFARRTLDDRNRQERAKAEQEETRARIMRVDEVMARVTLMERLEPRGLVPIWDPNGNIKIVRIESAETWARMRDRLLNDVATPVLEDKTGSTE